MYIIKNKFKWLIEQNSGGRCTVIEDLYGNPHIMYRLVTDSKQPVQMVNKQV